ncbi:MAG: HAMP domain-containing protein [Deltaproteobacteria bacterium]|nr:HAMP domain-containing protein [Deltaproteobacteria bacterium]
MAVLSAMVIAAVAAYLYLASRVFYEDKTVLVYEFNQNNVRTLASDVRADLKRILDKLKLIAAFSSVASTQPQTAEAASFSTAFADEDEIVRVAVLQKPLGSAAPVRTFTKVWPVYLDLYHKDSAYLDHLREVIPIPFDQVIAQGLWVRNATLDEEKSPPLMTIATVLDTGAAEAKTVIYADVRLDRMLEATGTGGIARAYVVDSAGHLLASSDQAQVLANPDVSSDPLVRAGLGSKVRSEVHRFDDGGKSYLGSYFQTGLAGVLVASRVETGEVFAAAERLIRKSLLFALMVVTAAFLVALFFSHALTKPIHTMLDATHRIAKGDFNSLIHVSSRDELATLASSFNLMTTDLRVSRDRIEEYSRDLEKKVVDRTARLEAQNVAIKEAQEALVRTTRLASVGEIAGRAAHEVLNPLTNVTARLEKMQTLNVKADLEDTNLLAEIAAAWLKELTAGGVSALVRSLVAPSTAHPGKTLLEEDILNLNAVASDLGGRLDVRRGDLEFLLTESGRISKIVNGMRQLTRVSGNRRLVSIHKVLTDTLATMTDVLRKSGIEVGTSFAGESVSVLADSDELIQVFSNLIRNSMQAIEDARAAGKSVGSPAKVWIETAVTVQSASRQVQIRLCDNGPGIVKENWTRVFDASFTTKSAEEGTGLGLSIARRFIRALDGEIIVEKSVEGVETVFLIVLPETHEQEA